MTPSVKRLPLAWVMVQGPEVKSMSVSLLNGKTASLSPSASSPVLSLSFLKQKLKKTRNKEKQVYSLV